MGNLDIIHWIKDYIEGFGIQTHLVPNEKGNKASLHCRIGPATNDGLILSGHTDVVPVKGQDWNSDPFVLTDKGDGKLYARGACDMKGFLACCLSMLPDMVKADLKKPLYFAFSYDEEIGCLAAPELIEHLLATYQEKPKYALIGEPSLMQPIVGQKAICVLQTTVNGSAGHSSRIKQEISAIHESARLILWLENKMNDLVNEGNSDQRFQPPHSSIHVGKFSSGIAPNVIADKATFLWDVRTIPADDIETIIADFQNHCNEVEIEIRKTFPEFKIETSTFHPTVPHLDTNENSDIVSLIQKISGNQKTAAVSFASEAGQFAQAGLQSIICGPGSIEQAHRADEFISKEQLALGQYMIGSLIKHFS